MAITQEEVARRLTPAHLQIPENTEKLKEEVQKLMEDSGESSILDDPRGQKEYTFDFKYKDGNGKIWKGRFTNKILTLRDRQGVGVVRARLAAGLPSEALDPLTAEINLMLAHMSFSLIERPEWAKDLSTLEDVRVVQALYEEVLLHEGTFHGYTKASSASASKS